MATYGLQLPDFSWLAGEPVESLPRIRSAAAAAEEAGFSSLWVMDHFHQLPPLGGPAGAMFEAYTLLGALAAVTERIRLGALVTGVTYRNPAMLAKQVTGLDVLSGGRAICGIGAAWYEEEHDALGWRFPPLRERYERLEEAVHVLRAMFREEVATFEGQHHQIREARNVPAPIQPGGPEIMIGGSGEQKTLRYVARLGDACNVSGSVEDVARRMALLDDYCGEVGREPSSLRRTRLGSMFVTASEAEAQGTRAFLEGVGADASTMVIGTHPQAVEQVQAYVAAGLDEVIFNLPQITSVDAIHAAGDVLAEACAG
jgi:F420-dependent oxidoreductase-like protein